MTGLLVSLEKAVICFLSKEASTGENRKAGLWTDRLNVS